MYIAHTRPIGALYDQELRNRFNSGTAQFFMSDGIDITPFRVKSLRGYHPVHAPLEPQEISEPDPANPVWQASLRNPDDWVTIQKPRSAYNIRKSRRDSNLLDMTGTLFVNGYNASFVFGDQSLAQNYVNNLHRYARPILNVVSQNAGIIYNKKTVKPALVSGSPWHIPAGLTKGVLSNVTDTMRNDEELIPMSNIAHNLTEDDMLMKSVPFDPKDQESLKPDEVLSNRFDYMGYDFTLCKKEELFFAARSIPLLRVDKSLSPDDHSKTIPLFIVNKLSKSPLWDSEDDIRAAINHKHAHVGM